MNPHLSAHKISMILKPLGLSDADLIRITQAIMLNDTTDLDVSTLTDKQIKALEELNVIKGK